MVKKGQDSGSNSAGAYMRMRKATRRQKRKMTKKEAKSFMPLPSGLGLLRQVFALLWQNWKLFGGITLIYLALNIILAGGLANISTAFSDVKNSLGSAHSFGDGLSSLASLATSSGTASSGSSGAVESILIILFSLVIIYALRQVLAGEKIALKQTFYNSTTPLIPFLLVLFVIILQLLPVTLITSIVALVLSALISSSGTVLTLTLIAMLPLAAWSFYMISSSIFALYIVTLPDMQPRQALRSAKKLVRFRRWLIIRKLIFLLFFIVVAFSVVMLPLILYVNVLVVPIFFILSTSLILLIHSYFYSLYRNLLT